MSGGHFDYAQYHIEDIANSIESLLEDLEKPRPPKKLEKWVSVRKQIGEGCYTYPMTYYKTLDGIVSVEAAEKMLLKSGDIIKKGGKLLDCWDTWTDNDGNKHPCEYTLKACEEWVDEDGHDECYYGSEFAAETIAEFRNAVAALREANVYAQRVDWLLSGDDGEEAFHKRLKKELQELQDEAKP